MPRKVTAYACIFGCKRHVMTSKRGMADHEARCFRNPARRACITRGNFGEESETIYDRHHGGDLGSSDYEIKVPYCEAGIEVYDEEKGAKLKHDCEKWKEQEVEDVR